ncbi:MAG: methyltransferase domain-containing protein [Oscillospiraceae bacterium]
MDLFTCPICEKKLIKESKQYYCTNNHCFDRAKSGYVNLLKIQLKNSKLPGDNKAMVDARHQFLYKKYYQVLLDALIKAVKKHTNTPHSVILDIGCGEGYYTNGIQRYMEYNGYHATIAGIDISKQALEKAAKQNKQISFAVASAFHIPVQKQACNMILNLFAPYCETECLRILREKGIMILVIPAENHLWELKEIVYPTPYKNEIKQLELENFTLLENNCINEVITLSCKEDILNLFTMTPYYYKTAKVDYERLERLDILKTTISFSLLVYQNKSQLQQ